MPYLVLMDGPSKGQHIQLASGTNRIGRVAGNAVVIDNPSVSSAHAEVTIGSTSCQLRDLDSTNGTRVNGQRITATELFRDDTILFGDLPVLFAGDDAPARPASAAPPADLAALGGTRPAVIVASVTNGQHPTAVCPPDFRKRLDMRLVWVIVVAVLLLLIALAMYRFISTVYANSPA